MLPHSAQGIATKSLLLNAAEEIYRSQNGDCWWLIRDTASGRAFIRHKANQSSDGHVTETGIEEFLSQRGSGLEYAALRRLVDRPGVDR